MRLHHIARVLLCLTSVTGAADAQRSVVPGDPALRAERVRIALDTIVLLRAPRDSTERVSSILYRRIERVGGSNGALLRETQRYESHEPSRPGMSYDTLEVEALTLRPVRAFFSGGGMSYDVRFRGLTMDGSLTTADSGSRSVHRTLAAAAFPGIMQEAFIAAFPLEAIGSTFTVPVMNAPGVEVRQARFEVARTDTLRTASGPVPSFLVASAGGHVEFWVAVDDGRLLRMHWTLPDGTSMWKLPEHDANLRDGVTP